MISADTENDSDVLAITGASAALALSSIPFTRTIAGVRVGLVDGEYLDQPDLRAAQAAARLDLIVAGSKDAIVMVEAGAKEVSEEEIVQALEHAHAAIKEIVAGIDALAKDAGKTKTRGRRPRRSPPTSTARSRSKAYGPLAEAMRIKDKLENYGKVDQVLAELRRQHSRTDDAEARSDAKAIFKELKEKVMRDETLERGTRLDGRKFDEIRPITIEVGVLPRTHGSAVFTRGETQALVTATLGTADDQQKIETVDGETWKRFMLHYNFPPFSVGEVQFLRGPGRREIGHGALAERALAPMIPAEEKFPYTIRVVSDILESNGSSSMASVCGGSLAMMDAGVPLKAPVAGVAMGLIMDEETGKYADPHRHRRRRRPLRRHGLQGRRHGRRASPRCRWTSRCRASRTDIMTQGARAGAPRPAAHPRQDAGRRSSAPRDDVSAHAPRIVTIRIPVDKIRDVIGPGGKMIRSIIERTGVKIDVEDDGRVNVASADEASAQKAIGIIQELTATPGAEQDLHGQGPADHRLRRVRRDHARASTACCTSPRSRTTASRTSATS